MRLVLLPMMTLNSDVHVHPSELGQTEQKVERQERLRTEGLAVAVKTRGMMMWRQPRWDMRIPSPKKGRGMDGHDDSKKMREQKG